MAKPALGRGLGALLGNKPAGAKPKPSADSPTDRPESTPPADEGGDRVRTVLISRITPCSFQPRRDFPPEAISELADSIREQGVIQPLLVRPKGDDFELIAGERRWRASQLAGLKEVPVIVREADDRGVLELALVENLQRENLNPMEEALGYSQLVAEFGITQEQAAVRVGKSRAQVANALRLLKLPEEIQGYVRRGALSVGHAKVILGIGETTDRVLAAQRVIRDNLSVRQLEEFGAAIQKSRSGSGGEGSGGAVHSAGSPGRDPHISDLEQKLREKLGTKVTLRYRKGRGNVDIRFHNDEELERILGILDITVD